ncbi:GCN5 family acetyltransferase [Thalassomonas actiniarum]|uniref:GNAT family N-acetyltransferase n=1 Tax=Thalassomonas actiniarum TaxID=485447 RepID=A0AAE9YLT6_9GAMM|nr:GCN5 family acetyltransferase [Thalassomonas actiniarum]WDD97700.1 GNAT family N-acetyltransferase [Thalassomonas actiniarum]
MTNVATAPTKAKVRATYLAAEDLKLAASLLYQAYHDDPVFLEIFNGEKEDYEQRLRASIREELGAFWHARQPMVGLYLGEAMVGVACLNGPDDGFGSERFWHWRLKMLLSAGYFSTKQMIEKEEIILSAVPLEKFHMLSFIAIHPLHQHYGFGHYLMAAVSTVLEEHPDSEGVAVYATSEKYREFFKDVDYQFIREINVGNVSGALMVHYREQKNREQTKSQG